MYLTNIFRFRTENYWKSREPGISPKWRKNSVFGENIFFKKLPIRLARKPWFHFNGFSKILFRDTNCTATFWRFWGASCWKSRFPGFELQKMQGSLCLSIFDTINLSAFMSSAASVEIHTNKKDVWKNILQVCAILPGCMLQAISFFNTW